MKRMILIDGKHLDLIKDLEDFQRENKEMRASAPLHLRLRSI